MSRFARSTSSQVNDPATMPNSRREYYRSTWGFDPVADCRILSNGRFRYEECFPLSQDLPLHIIGVTVCARVDWEGEDIHNRIAFRRTDDNGRRRKASVECTHTVVYAGPASDAFDLADKFETISTLPNIQPPDPQEMLNRRQELVTLPPWEHFAALKSYVAAVADMGVIALLRQSITAPTGSTEGLPFGFNAEMQEQVARALRAIAPRAMASIYRGLTCEFLDTPPPVAQVNQWMDRSVLFQGKSKRKHWGLLLRHLDTYTLVHLFRHTDIADKLQDRLFTKRALLATAKEIAPDLPWDTLFLEWEARRAAKDFAPDDDSNSNGVGGYLQYIPHAEIWARIPFCGYAFLRDILSPDTTALRRSRVQAYIRVMKREYKTGLGDVLTDHYLDWTQKVSSHMDDFLTTPFPADRARPKAAGHWNNLLKHYIDFTPAEVVDSIERGDHQTRRNVALCYPVPPELQEKLATHWDFVTRLALVGNPGTVPAIIAKLAQDPQPCTNLAAAARVRRGTASCEPLFGEILDPGEIVWLLSSHPGIVFQFGVTTWGDGSGAYHEWVKNRLREIKARDEYLYLPGELYAWAYSEGIFLEEDVEGLHGSHLAYYGLTPYACGQLPCLYLGLYFLGDRIIDL